LILFSTRSVIAGAAGLILLLGIGVRIANLGNVNSRTPDERVYRSQADTWRQQGTAGLRSLVAGYERDPEARLYPPPTRVGMIRLVAAAMSFTGRDDESAGAILSCAASIGSLLMLALIGLRFFPPWAALCGLLFYAVSPPELVIARRAWADAVVELIGLGMVYAACEITRDSRRWSAYAGFAIAGALGVAVKESAGVPLGLCGIWLLWVLAVERREFRNAVILVGGSVLAVAVSVGWLAWSVGSLSDVIQIVAGIPGANATNAYALEYASGAPWLLLQAFWIISPVTALFFAGGVFAAFTDREGTAQWITLFTVVQIAIAIAIPHWLNLRYVSVAFGCYSLVAGLGIWFFVSFVLNRIKAQDRKALAMMLGLVAIGGAIADYARFERYFVRDGTADLSVKMVLDERNR
jgi:4-amino-4-deoxy-L-arabinose transferase-like glycosyltransferase